MRAKKMAAYTLATCMTVTVAPIGATNVFADETIESVQLFAAAETITIEEGKGVEFSIKNTIKAGDKFSDITNKLTLKYNAGTWSDGHLDWGQAVTTATASGATLESVTILDENDNPIWASDGSLDTADDTKFEAGKKYYIAATFSNIEITGASATNVANGNKDSNGNYEIGGEIYLGKANGLDDEIDGTVGGYIYRDADGNRAYVTTVAQNKQGWFLVENGIATEYNDGRVNIASNKYGTWYCYNGKVDFTKTGIVTDTNTAVKYYVEKGQVTGKKTGFVEDTGVLYNVVNSKVTTCDPTVAFDGKSWRYIASTGVEDPSKEGFAKNQYGTWYVKDGKVKFDVTDAKVVDDSKDIGTSATAEYYVVKGQAMLNKTGVVFIAKKVPDTGVDATVDPEEPYYVKNGVIQPDSIVDKYIDKDTLVYNPSNKKWYLVGTNGQVKKTPGVYANEYGTWLVDNTGTVNFNISGLWDDGTDKWLVSKGQVMKNVTDVVADDEIASTGASVTPGSGKVYVKNGKVTGLDINEAVVYCSDKNWYFVDSTGAVNTSYSGIAGNQYGIWKFNSGTINFTDTANPYTVKAAEDGLKDVNHNDKIYIKGSKFQKDFTGVIGNDYYEKGIAKTSTSFLVPTLVQDENKDWVCVTKNGVETPAVTGFVSNQYGTWYVVNNKVDITATGLYTDADGLSGKATDVYYVEKGKVITSKNGIVEAALDGSGSYKYNIENGKAAGKTLADSVVQAPDKKWYYVDKTGKVDTTYTGLAGNKYGVWYIDSGVVEFNETSLKDANTLSDGTPTQAQQIALVKGLKSTDKIFINKSQVMTNFTGVAVTDTAAVTNNKYVKNGIVATNGTKSEVIQGSDKKWYSVKNGIAENVTGLKTNAYGKWYVKGGIVDFTKTGIITDGTDDYYVEKGQMKGDKNGLITVGKNKYYVKDSKVLKSDSMADSLKYINGTWYCIDTNGKVASSSVELGGNENGLFKVKDGKVDFTATEKYRLVAGDPTLPGIANGDDIYIENGKFQADKTCLYVHVNLAKNGYDYDYVVNGKVTTPGFTKNTAVQGTDKKWYCVQDGNVTSTYLAALDDTLAVNDYGVWYVNNGVVDFTKTGVVETDVETDGSTLNSTPNKYYFEKGKFLSDKDGIVSSGTDKYYVENGVVTKPTDKDSAVIKGSDNVLYYVDPTDGKVNKSYTGLAANDAGIFYIKNGVVDTTKTGLYSTVIADAVTGVTGGTDTVYVNAGKVDLSYSGIVSDQGQQWLVNAGKLDKSTGTNYVKKVKNSTDKYAVDNQGRVMQAFTGDATDGVNHWYVKNGKVDTTFTGEYDGHKYSAGKRIS